MQFELNLHFNEIIFLSVKLLNLLLVSIVLCMIWVPKEFTKLYVMKIYGCRSFWVAKHTFSHLDCQIIYKTITWNKKQTIIYLKSTNCLKSFLSLLDSIKSLEPLVNDLFLFVESDIMNRWKIWAKIMVELSEWWQ